MVEQLKPAHELTEPDPRRLGWAIRNNETGAVRQLTLDEHYVAVERLALSVPTTDQIETQYNTARNVLLYSWFVYRFTTVAELQAYATLEYALRWKLGCLDDERPPTLAPLLRRAAQRGLVVDGQLAHLRGCVPPVYTGNGFVDANIDPQVVAGKGHVALLCEVLPKLRNQLAHGSINTWPSALGTFLLAKALVENVASGSVAPAS